MKVFSLKNCDTCRKAIKALQQAGQDFDVIDVRADAPSPEDIAAIVDAVGYEKALNRRSATWRSLQDPSKSDMDNVKAVSLITDFPTLMKRPAIMKDDVVTVGWDKDTQDQWL